MGNESSDFRYNTGDTKVPWAAVGENYNAADTFEFVKFLMQGKGAKYNAALKDVKAAIAALGKVSTPPGKLSMGDKVAEVEKAIDQYLGVEEGSSLFVSNCTAALELGYRYAGAEGRRAQDHAEDEDHRPRAHRRLSLRHGRDHEGREEARHRRDGGRGARLRRRVQGPQARHDRALRLLLDARGQELHLARRGRHLRLYRAEARRARFLGVDFSSKIKNWLYNVSLIKGKGRVRYQASNNASVTEIQALGLLLQIKRYDRILRERTRLATYVTKRLSKIPGVMPQLLGDAKVKPTFHLYQLQIDPKVCGGTVQTLKAKLEEKGVTNIPHFGPIYRFSAAIGMGCDEKKIAATCPVTEKVFDERYTHLPIYGLTKEQVDFMVDAIAASVAEMKAGK